MAVVGCLPNGNSVAVFQTILYFAAAFLGFFVTIPVGITLRNFYGSCILYAQIVPWGTAIIWPWSETSCDFILYMNLAINIFYATFMAVLTLIIAMKAFRSYHQYRLLEDWHISFILTAFNPVFLIINSLITILHVAGVAIITNGLKTFCQYTMTYVTNLPNSGNSTAVPKTCSDLQKWNGWSEMRIVRGMTTGVNGSNFFGCLTLATVAEWLLMIVWFSHLILNVFMSCRICSCEVAEEKRKPDKSMIVAQRRSRLATPIGTPGGRYTPGGLNQPMAMMPPAPSGPPQESYYPSKTPPLPDPSLPPYRVTPPQEVKTPLPSTPEQTSPHSMSVLKEKQVYRRNPSDSQI